MKPTFAAGVARHPFLKLFSLALAVGFWLFVHGEKHVEIRATVKVEPVNLPGGLTIVGEFEPKISLRLAGPRTRLRRIQDGFFKPYLLDLSGEKAGTVALRVSEGEFDIPRGTKIVRISPDLIRVRLETVEEKILPVVPTFMGDLGEVGEVAFSEVTPHKVRVRGPRNVVEQLTEVRTVPVDLAGRKSGFSGAFEVDTPGPGVRIDPSKVDVRVEIRPAEKAKAPKRQSELPGAKLTVRKNPPPSD